MEAVKSIGSFLIVDHFSLCLRFPDLYKELFSLFQGTFGNPRIPSLFTEFRHFAVF